MKQNDKYRPFVSTDYKPLHTLLPLKSPLRLGIGFTTRCNFKCVFCYLNTVEKSKLQKITDMPLKLVEKIAKDLGELDEQISVADVSQNGESLLYKELPTAIKLLNDTKKIGAIRIITNASLLTPQKTEQLIDAGLKQVMVSINGLSDEQYQSVTHTKVKFSKILENVKHLFLISRKDKKCHIHIKCIANYFSEDEQNKFLEIFSPYADSIHIDKVVNQWIGLQLTPPPYERKENIDRFNKNIDLDLQNKPICSAPFYFLRFHPSGIASVCLGDWEAAMSVGNVNKESVKEIWNGEKLANLRRAQLLRHNIPEQCDKCYYYELATGEGLTPYTNELLKKYSLEK